MDIRINLVLNIFYPKHKTKNILFLSSEAFTQKSKIEKLITLIKRLFLVFKNSPYYKEAWNLPFFVQQSGSPRWWQHGAEKPLNILVILIV